MAFSSKANWYDKGEKSNKFFLNLHSLKRSQKLITNIKDGNKEFKGHAEVTLGIRSFYEDLYKKNTNINNSENGSFYDECPKLSDSNREHMEKEISLKELYDALVSCKPSAPGPDGIPYEIYKSFWRIIGPVVLDSWKYSIDRVAAQGRKGLWRRKELETNNSFKLRLKDCYEGPFIKNGDCTRPNYSELSNSLCTRQVSIRQPKIKLFL